MLTEDCKIVSVVIPVYRVQRYLDRCVQSVLAQTYAEIEVLLIDDGSPDRCGELCDAWAKKDSRVRAFHKPNGGLSDARNYGAARARGAYLTFVDSDDVLAPDCIEYLAALMRQSGCDLACCDLVEFEQDPCAFPQQEPDAADTVTGVRACELLMGEKYMPLVPAWGKLYRAKTVRSFPFPVGRIHEDEATTCKYLYSSRTVTIGTRRLYGYRQRPESIMGRTRKRPEKTAEDRFWCMRHRAEWFEEQGNRALAKQAWSMVLNVALSDCLNGISSSEAQLRQSARACAARGMLDRKIRLKLAAYRLAPRLYSWYWKRKWREKTG